ncbi:MAG: hypothetical protein AAB515_03210 [Patescibacteria group bacterium]
MANKNMVGNVPDDERLGADDCLGLIIDIITKVKKRIITKRQLELFAQGKNPFAMPTILTVNGDDPRWQSIRKKDYYYVNTSLSVVDFPIVPGVREVAYDVKIFDHEPTTQEVVDWQNEPRFRPLDRADSETYLDAVPDTKADLGESPIVCLGAVAGGGVAYVGLHGGGRDLRRIVLGRSWNRYCRFVRVRK